MAATTNSSRGSAAIDRSSHWVFSQEIPTDVVVQVGEAKFPLHKFLLVAKSGYITRKIIHADRPDLNAVDLTGIPGGADAFERAAKFCYGVNFEISVYNVAALRCAAEFLEMTDEYCAGNLAGRTEEFLARAALKTLPGAVIVLRSCEALLPMADEIHIVQRSVDAISVKACNESNFPTRSPPEWWLSELSTVGPPSFQKILSGMRSRGVPPRTLATAVVAYTEKSLPGLVSLSGASFPSGETRSEDRGLLESVVSLLPPKNDAPLAVGFLCCLLRAAIYLECAADCRRKLESRIADSLDEASPVDLLTVTLDYGGERVADLDSARRIVAGFVEREMGGGGGLYGGGAACCSAAAQKVARTVDSFVCEIATDESVGVSKFAGVAGALPKSARRFDDDLYRAVDIYLKAHPDLDEIEREKVCSVMDPLRLSYEARLHASQNKRLPVQIVLHALYYDRLSLRSGAHDDPGSVGANAIRGRAVADTSLMRENETLRSELTRMKMYMSGVERGGQGSSGGSSKGPKRPTLLSSFSRKLGKLNPFRSGSKDTFMLETVEAAATSAKPRRRRFSIS